MRKPWSISTTVRSPERLKGFLQTLSRLEGREFDKASQIEYQILLIQDRIYTPLEIPQKYRKYWGDPQASIPYEVAKRVFELKKYEDPPMRGRQSVNPLNKLGFAIARDGEGPISITELGRQFMSGDRDIGLVFFKSLLKLQFPNPWSTDFTSSQGFDIMPLAATMHLIRQVNLKSQRSGLSRTEFCIFVPTLISASEISSRADTILHFRSRANKSAYIEKYVKEFLGVRDLPGKKLNNLFDYGDNTMRYFRMTRYLKVTSDPLGGNWTIDLEKWRMAEIEQLLSMYDGSALDVNDKKEYLAYISDISKPELPWENLGNLGEVALSIRAAINNTLQEEQFAVPPVGQQLLDKDIMTLGKEALEDHIAELRELNLDIISNLQKMRLRSDYAKIKELISILRTPRALRKYQPEQFEKLITEALRIINDELLIKPNYPMDDNGEPIGHAAGNKADLECYYETFKATCEVTLDTSKLQWVREGQPVMRHLRDFERLHDDANVFCLFIAPQIHNDTQSQFWTSVKYEYDGARQKIVPLTTENFSMVVETMFNQLRSGKSFNHRDLRALYNRVVESVAELNGFTEWAAYTTTAINEWQEEIQNEG